METADLSIRGVERGGGAVVPLLGRQVRSEESTTNRSGWTLQRPKYRFEGYQPVDRSRCT